MKQFLKERKTKYFYGMNCNHFTRKLKVMVLRVSHKCSYYCVELLFLDIVSEFNNVTVDCNVLVA